MKSYNNRFIAAGAVGNIGQRDVGLVGGELVVVQEANVGHMPPTLWADWRVWLYMLGSQEGLPPTGAGTVHQLAVETDLGSTAFGNPSVKLLPCPRPSAFVECVFVSMFLFGEGAKPGEAGVLAFYNRAPPPTQ
jgi:hypothetical protein